MLSIGWTEMLVIAAVALIVVGPRDLPAMLRQVGRVVGTVRRMGNEFRREVNKLAAMEEVKEMKKSFTEPMREAEADIQRQFNKVTDKGVEPSGAIKPADPKAESIVDELRAAAGMTGQPATTPAPDAAKASMAAAVQSARAEQTAAAATATKPALKPRAKKPATKPATDAAPAAAKPAAKSRSAAKPAAKKAAPAKPTVATAPEPVAKPTKKPRAAKPKPVAAADEQVASSSAVAKPRARRAASKKAE